MNVWYSKYQLYPKGTLNSKNKTKFRQGALLRVRTTDGKVGYSDLCPFSEMGDRPIDSELKGLATAKLSPLALRSLSFAKLDAEARSKSATLYDANIKIKNHFLISDISRFDMERVATIEASGYTEFKVKMGRDLVTETEGLQTLAQNFSPPTKLRLDFNCALSSDRFVNWFDKHQKWLRPVLEFVEDPFNYDPAEWRTVSQKRGVTFALDQAADAVKTGADGAQIIVVKPAIHDQSAIIEAFKNTNKKFVFTHYMDFPAGQMFAYICAQNAKAQVGEQFLTCGLQHHDIYEGFTFQDAVKYDGPYILPPNGLGIGFDDLFASLKWSEL